MRDHVEGVFDKHLDRIYELTGERDVAGVLKIVKKHPELLRNGYLEGTLTHVAAIENLPELIDYAASVGVDIDVFEVDEGTPLHAAARSGSLEAAEALLRLGANVNDGVHRRATPLEVAAGAGHIKLVALLIQNGADVNAGHRFQGSRVTPLSAALAESHEDSAKLLRQHGATHSDNEIPIELAWEAFDDERYQEAAGYFTSAATQWPELDIYYDRGVAHDMSGKYDEAVADFTSALQLNPRHSRALYSRHVAYRNLKKWEAAFQDIVSAYALSPRDFRIVNAYAQFLVESPVAAHRNAKLAVEVATTACVLSNCDELCLHTLIQAHREAGNSAQANKLAKQLRIGDDDD